MTARKTLTWTTGTFVSAESAGENMRNNTKQLIKWLLIVGLVIYWIASTAPTEKDIRECVKRGGHTYEYCDVMLHGN